MFFFYLLKGDEIMDKDIMDRLKELLGEEPQPLDDNFWLFGLLILMLIGMPMSKEEPTINIYLGSEE